MSLYQFNSKRIRVFSDMHINIPDSGSNDFSFSDKEIIIYFSGLISDNQLLVLNGDIFECWETNFKKQTRHFEQIRAEHRTLFKFLVKHIKKQNIILISGNHDSVVRTRKLLENIVRSCTINITSPSNDTNYKIYIEHGHRGDPFMQKNTIKCSRAFSWCGGMIEQSLYSDIDKSYSKLERIVSGNKNSIDNELEGYAFDLAEEGNYNIVVLGHTHRSYIRATGGDKRNHYKTRIGEKVTIYCNTGTAMGEDGYIEGLEINVSNDGKILVEIFKDNIAIVGMER